MSFYTAVMSRFYGLLCVTNHRCTKGTYTFHTHTHMDTTWSSITVCTPFRQQMLQPCHNSLTVFSEPLASNPLSPQPVPHQRLERTLLSVYVVGCRPRPLKKLFTLLNRSKSGLCLRLQCIVNASMPFLSVRCHDYSCNCCLILLRNV